MAFAKGFCLFVLFILERSVHWISALYESSKGAVAILLTLLRSLLFLFLSDTQRSVSAWEVSTKHFKVNFGLPG